MNKATAYTPKCIHVPAAEGQPSTFWKSASGKYYRTKAEAIADNGNDTCNPEKFRIDKSFFTKYKTYILGALVAAIVVAGLFYFGPKIAAKFKK